MNAPIITHLDAERVFVQIYHGDHLPISASHEVLWRVIPNGLSTGTRYRNQRKYYKNQNQNQAIIYREDVIFSIAGHSESGIPVASFFEIKLVSKPRHVILDDSPTVRILAIKVSKTRTLYAYPTNKVE